MALPKEILKTIISLCAPKLKDFKKIGNHFHRHEGDIIHCIHFQSSQWNSGATGQFTVNLIITSEPLYKIWTGKSMPKNPATAMWPIQVRLGMLAPRNSDKWWPLAEGISPEAIAIEITKMIEDYGLPFFSRYSSIDDILKETSKDQKGSAMFVHKQIVRAIILSINGDQTGAKRELEAGIEALKKKGISGEVYLTIAERLNISISA